MSFFSSTWINGASMPQVVLRAGGDIPPPLNQRYITMLDGQSKFWRRNTEWTSGSAGASVDTLFFPNDISRSSRQYVTDDSESNPERLYVSIEPNTGNISWDSSITVTSAKLNGQTIARNSTPPEQGKINRVELTTTTQVSFGNLGSKNDGADFFDGAVFSVEVVDASSASNSFSHPLDTNLTYDLADGTTDPLAGSTLIFENGSIDQSDRLLVTEKQDGTGFVGETGINYNYATGANPETSTYSSEYSSEYS